MKGTNSMFDIIIIGSGPAGLSAAIYAKRANLNVAVAEKEYEGTGQIAESGNVNNYLGFPNINGYDLGEKFRGHSQIFLFFVRFILCKDFFAINRFSFIG